MIEMSPAWSAAYPGASIGVLAMRGIANPASHPALDERKQALEESLRAQYTSYDRASLKTIPALAAYDAYYGRFDKTYHVQLQLESLVFKNKPIPQVAALVEAMFMAELKNLLLTAGHDLQQIEPPVRVDVAGGTESYVRMNGEEQVLKAGDMLIADAQGILSCILYGPDRRTRIQPETTAALFTVYAPPGISVEAVRRHLADLRDNAALVAPGATVVQIQVFEAR